MLGKNVTFSVKKIDTSVFLYKITAWQETNQDSRSKNFSKNISQNL